MVIVKRQRLATFEVENESMVSIDPVSILPQELLGLILSFLTPKEATATSILSHSWKYLWTSTPNLNLDGSIEKRMENYMTYCPYQLGVLLKERANYISWVNRVIALPQTSNLEEFRVCFDLHASHKEWLDKWLSYALSRKTQILELNLIDFTGSGVYSHGCSYTFPYGKGNLPNNFKLLKQLSLHLVNVSGKALKFFLRNCPLLERLSVSQSQTLSFLKISRTFPSFKCLEISGCNKLDSIVVRNSNVVNIKYSGESIHFPLVNVPLLTELWIGGGVTICMEDVIEMFRRVLPQLEVLKIYFSVDELSLWDFRDFASVVEMKNLKQMVVNLWECCRDTDYLVPIVCLIKASPCLQKFVLEAPPNKLKLDKSKNLLGAGGEEDAIMETLQINHSAYAHLKDVEFVGYKGDDSRQYGLIMHFVNNNAALENIIIDPRGVEPRLHRPWQHIYQHKRDQEDIARAYAKEQLEEHVPSRINLNIL